MEQLFYYYRKFKQGIENLLYYFEIIWNDRQWDYEFFYYLELKKVQKMIQWWSSSDPVTSTNNVLRDLRICEYLLKVLTGKIDYLEMTPENTVTFKRYVNLKNIKRFISLKYLSKEWLKSQYFVQDLYQMKCKNLYYTIRNYRIATWWD